eukprot:TRINITY_DN13882_c0_g5_i1.p1 TRINITY_DN13882_c0_g5~~TRINITY_DN13882_c0_g5_i1.p1  ORF type:complete len:1278 (+),score=288.79 TRINITY_DN13882_c0_g5_i1:117-3950(+)
MGSCGSSEPRLVRRNSRQPPRRCSVQQRQQGIGARQPVGKSPASPGSGVDAHRCASKYDRSAFDLWVAENMDRDEPSAAEPEQEEGSPHGAGRTDASGGPSDGRRCPEPPPPLREALRTAHLARITHVRIEGTAEGDSPADAGAFGLYLRSFSREAEWVKPDGQAVLRSAEEGLSLTEGERTTVLPCDPASPSGWVTLPGGARAKISFGRGGAAVLHAHWGLAPADLHLLVDLAERLGALKPGSELDKARGRACHQRAKLIEAQQEASKDRSAGALQHRDAVRQDALDAQEAFVRVLESDAVSGLISDDGEQELVELEERLALCGAPADKMRDADAAAAAAAVALHQLNDWQTQYEQAVEDRERRTDLAVAAAQRHVEDGTSDLEELADRITKAAEAESDLRAEAGGVSEPPLCDCAAAVGAGLRSLDENLGAVRLLRAECAEAVAVRDELAEGCREAAGGRFRARVEGLVAEATGRGTPPPGEAEAAGRVPGDILKSVRVLRKQAAKCQIDIDSADPASCETLTAQRDNVLRQLRERRRELASEGVELLRLARTHFPECIDDLCRALPHRLSRELMSQHPAALRLFLSGGSLSDYQQIGHLPRGSAQRDIIRAESRAGCGDGAVLIKKVYNMDDGADLDAFMRGIRMMEAAGDAAVSMRQVFLTEEWGSILGCVVMDDYPHTLETWLADEARDLTPARVLRMVRRLLGCLVRLHNPSREFPGGIVHGDIDPGNIVVDRDGQPRLIGFELSRADASKTMIHMQSAPSPYTAPELFGATFHAEMGTTKASDVFGMGAVLEYLLAHPNVARAAGAVAPMLSPLVSKMMNAEDPSARPTASAALDASELSEALDKHVDNRLGDIEAGIRRARDESRRAMEDWDRVQAARMKVAEDKRRCEALKRHAADAAEELRGRAAAVEAATAARQDQLEERAWALWNRWQQLAAESERLAAEERELSAARRRAKAREAELKRKHAEMRELSVEFPKHWTSRLKVDQGWRAVAVPPGSDHYNALAAGIKPDPALFMPGAHSTLTLKCAWRIENPARWLQYGLARRALKSDIEAKRLPAAIPLRVRRGLAETLGPRRSALPEQLQNHGGLNELRLFHATRPEHLLQILHHGFNPLLAGSSRGTAFGCGTYFAEDAGKSDQYATGHTPGRFPDVEQRLYGRDTAHPGASVYYVFVCRVTCGCFATTDDGECLLGGTERLWAAVPKNENWRTTGCADPRRELCLTPGTLPDRARYSSLLVETGPGHTRYREVVMFDAQRIYPEYLLAYVRE